MPNRDGTGPMGYGPRSGRGLGPCGQGKSFRRGQSRRQGYNEEFGNSYPILEKLNQTLDRIDSRLSKLEKE